MSNSALRWARAQHTGGAATKCVLLLLADNLNDATGLCSPGTRALADAADTDQKQVRLYLDRLRDAGLISWTEGPRRSRRYLLHVEKVRHRGDEMAILRPSSEGTSPSLGAGDDTALDDGSSEGASPSAVRGRPPRSAVASPSKPQVTPTEPKKKAAAGGRSAQRIADLNSTAHSSASHQLVAAWAAENPGVLRLHRTEMAQAVNRLLTDGADPTLVRSALDEAQSNPEWRNPARALPYAYDRVRRGAVQASSSSALTVAAPRSGRVPTTTQRVADIEALRHLPGEAR